MSKSKADDKNYEAAKALVEKCMGFNSQDSIENLGAKLIGGNTEEGMLIALQKIVLKNLVEPDKKSQDFFDKVLKFIEDKARDVGVDLKSGNTMAKNFIASVEEEKRKYKEGHTAERFADAEWEVSNNIKQDKSNRLAENLFFSTTAQNEIKIPIKEIVLTKLAEAIETGDTKTQKFLGKVNDELLELTKKQNNPHKRECTAGERDDINKFLGDCKRTIEKAMKEKAQKGPKAPTVTPQTPATSQQQSLIIHL